MYVRLFSFIKKYDLLYEYQFGFRQSFDTGIALVFPIDTILKAPCEKFNCGVPQIYILGFLFTVFRIIKSLLFRAHTSPYFDELNIINIFQLCKYKVILFMLEYVQR